MKRSVAVLNQKGGVGKTTVVLGLASAALNAGVRTLVVDLDAQANATWSLGVEPSLENLGTGDAMQSTKTGAAADMIVPSGWSDDIWLLPGGHDLTERENDRQGATTAQRLRRALDGVADSFDLVLIDCAPSLGLNTSCGLTAADGALIIVEPTVFGLRGINPVLDLVDSIWDEHNSNLDIAGVVLNRVPPTSNDANNRIEELYGMVGRRAVWTPAIPNRVLINEAHNAQAPIHSYGSRARGLPEIFDELLARLRRWSAS